MRVKLILAWVTLLLLLVSSSLAAQAVRTSANYNFVYVYQAQQGEIRIGMIDPTTTSVSENVVPISVGEFWSLTDAAKNANNEWIALAFRAGTGYVMRLVNLTTTETRDIASDFLLAPPSTGIMGPQQEFVWSPDGRYLAFNTYKPGTEPRTDTLLYSLDANQTITLTDDAAWQTRLAWSPDSRQLAIATVTCTENCVASIDLYDPSSNTRTASLNITPDAFGANSPGRAGVCHLQWSPDGRYISFMANCDGLEYAAYKEMYVLEVVSGTLTQITHITYEQDPIVPNYAVFADYEPIWVDNNILLISTIHGIGENIRSETLEYNVTTGTLNKISDQYVVEWAVNPVSQQLAFRSIGTNPNDYQHQRESQPVEIVPLTALSRVTTARDMLPASLTTSPGCNLMWSPDGAVLAYSIPKTDHCLSSPQGFRFVNTESGAVTDYAPSFNGSAPFTVIAMGWVEK